MLVKVFKRFLSDLAEIASMSLGTFKGQEGQFGVVGCWQVEPHFASLYHAR